MSFDHMSWQLTLEQLYAEANLYANEAVRILVGWENDPGADPSLSAALVKAEQWKVVQDEIQQHIHNHPRGGR